MSRRAAIVTQADVHRVVLGAKRAGARQVVVRPDGAIVILIDEDAAGVEAQQTTSEAVDDGEIIDL